MELTKLRNHKMTGIKGILAIIFGLIALFFPGGTLMVLAKVFGILALLAGAVVVTLTYTDKTIEWNRRFWFIEGVVDIIVGILLLAFPKVTISILLIIIAIWAIVMGIIQLSTANRFKEIMNHKILLVNGVIALLFGILIFTNPFEGGKVLIAAVGLLALVYGIISLYTSYKMNHNQGSSLETGDSGEVDKTEEPE